MRRSRLTQALILSLALHLGLGLVLFLAPAPEREPSTASRQPLQVEIVVRTPPPPVEPPRPTLPAPKASPPPRPPRAATRPPRTPAPPSLSAPPPPSGATAAAPPPAAAEPETPSGAVPDAPRAVRLFPGPGGLPVPPSMGDTRGGSTGGRTLRPGDGPSREQLLAEEGARVQGRVQGFLDDGMARLRVENGLVDSFFGDMDKALEKGLSGAPLFAYEGVFKHFFKATPERGQGLRELLASVQRYGATGSPDAVGEPSGTDKLEDVARSGTAGSRARSRPSTFDMLETYNKAAGALHAKIELEQTPTGQMLSVKLVESSGNPLFDAYVLEKVPPSLAALPPASEHFAARAKGNVRSVWAIEGHVSFSRTLKVTKLDELDAGDAAYLSALMPLGFLSGRFEETRGEVIVPDFRRPHFDIRAQLLRVY
ncbi:TonB C-terminal domain-containing protein [Archangium violaceum]|uniref:TonB C-terminal domain-containing protein n=1 Tax=Archangium violaceum TaxID=83451 RepID=UPI00194FB078|nr:TonB C-terminal domain-containing protein [Archangium violaceum]QRN92819.1 TonB C-terminal domain-containing protein [Archangium violaceum]